LALEFNSGCSLQNSGFELQDLIFLQNVMKINKTQGEQLDDAAEEWA
jgi:hypothetical protein